MLSLSENWVRLLTAMVSIDGVIYTQELDELEKVLEEYTSFPSSILTDLLKEMPLQGKDLEDLILSLTDEISPKSALPRIALLYRIGISEAPLQEKENQVLIKTISHFLSPEAISSTLPWLENQRIADVQLQELLKKYT